MPVEKLRELAGGRIYTGSQAKDNGLVDELGTLNDAIAEAKKLAGLESDAEVRIGDPARAHELLRNAVRRSRQGGGSAASAKAWNHSRRR